jgi:hypothetical protein
MKHTLLLALFGVYLCASQVTASELSLEHAADSSAAELTRYRSPGDRHKVLIDATNIDKAKVAVSGSPHLNYGSFSIYLVDAITADKLIRDGLARPADAQNLILFNVGALDTRSDIAQLQATNQLKSADKHLFLVQFPGPIQDAWVRDLASTGAQIVSYMANNAYLVYGDVGQINAVNRLVENDVAQWSGPYLDNYKMRPGTLEYAIDASNKSLVEPPSVNANALFDVQLVKDAASNQSTEAMLATNNRTPISRYEILRYVNLVVEIAPDRLKEVAARPDVIAIAPYIEPTKHDERQDMILAGNLTAGVPNAGNYLTTLANWGFTQAQFNASNFVVDVTDDGADRNPTGADPGTIGQDTNAGPVPARHFVLYEGGLTSNASRFIYKGRWGTAVVTDGGLGKGGHGQLNMSIVGGFVPDALDPTGTRLHRDAQLFRYGLGVAPFVRLANSVIFEPGFTSPNLPNMLNAGYASGARLSSNSWGANVAGAYNANAQTYDALVRDAQAGTAGNQPVTIMFSAGNAGPNSTTIGSPGTAKNVITVGAAEGVQSFAIANGGGNATGADQCNTADNEADSAQDIVGFSSRGPTTDGRIKPDLVAPGTHISGMTYVTTDSSGNGTVDVAYRGSGVCGGSTATVPPANTPTFFPAAQRWYTASSGTSHSAPAVSGGAALVYQQFINNPAYIGTYRTPPGSAPPSPAMVKAYLANSARYMTGASANDNLPSNSQGMGMMNLGTAFDGIQRVLRDQEATDTFGATGETRTQFFTVVDSTKPVRISLAWLDAPGPITGSSVVNNLDLKVSTPNGIFLGNRFSGANSVIGGTADAVNNLENVFFPAGLAAGTTIIVTVSASNIAGDGLPANADLTDQDYALVAYNVSPGAPQALLGLSSTALPTGNSLIEPNECNALNINLVNNGTLSATAISSVLSTSTAGVNVTQDASAYPDLAANGTGANNLSYQVSTASSVACGSTIDLAQTVTYTGGATVTIPLSFRVGQAPDPNYVFAADTATLTPAATLVPTSNDDDKIVTVTTPFAFSLYGNAVNAGQTVTLSTNGNMQVLASGGTTSLNNSALPSTVFGATTTVLMPYWDDLDLRVAGNGIYTSVSGTAPNQIWTIEWRGTVYQATGVGPAINFTIRLFEGQDRFEFVYNNAAAAFGAGATIGAQAANSGTNFTQYSFNTASLITSRRLSAARVPGICVAGPGPCSAPGAIFANGFE